MNIIRYYNQNRKKIWGIIIIIVSAFIFLKLINEIYAMQHKKEVETLKNNQDKIQEQTNNTKLETNKSVVTGEEKSPETLSKDTTVIDKFINFCNNKKIEEAYNLLTDECKQEMYDTLEKFEQAYYNEIFKGENKTCIVENWINNTYKVKITEDMLATGKSSNKNSIQDYITVEENKLNINNYIGHKEINEITNKDNIQMEVLSKDTYMEYEKYTIKVTNNTNMQMLLDGGTNVESLYLQDSKGSTYSAYTHELTKPMLSLSSGETKEVTIKFYSSYISTKKIENIIFSDLLLYKEQEGQQIEYKAKV